MQYRLTVTVLAALLSGTSAGAAVVASAAMPAATAAIYQGAGFIVRGAWPLGCNSANPAMPASRFVIDMVVLGDDPGTGTQPQAIVNEINAPCFGREAQAFTIVARNADGSWRNIGGGSGTPTLLGTRQGGWRDIAYGRPTLAERPVLHWNGTRYQ